MVGTSARSLSRVWVFEIAEIRPGVTCRMLRAVWPAPVALRADTVKVHDPVGELVPRLKKSGTLNVLISPELAIVSDRTSRPVES